VSGKVKVANVHFTDQCTMLSVIDTEICCM